MTARSLAELCGVDEQTVTKTWIAKEGLKSCRRGTARTPEQGNHHWIAHTDFIKWLRSHRHRVDLRRVNAVWFFEYVIFPQPNGRADRAVEAAA